MKIQDNKRNRSETISPETFNFEAGPKKIKAGKNFTPKNNLTATNGQETIASSDENWAQELQNDGIILKTPGQKTKKFFTSKELKEKTAEILSTRNVSTKEGSTSTSTTEVNDDIDDKISITEEN